MFFRRFPRFQRYIFGIMPGEYIRKLRVKILAICSLLFIPRVSPGVRGEKCMLLMVATSIHDVNYWTFRDGMEDKKTKSTEGLGAWSVHIDDDVRSLYLMMVFDICSRFLRTLTFHTGI